jgi:MIP family channel proteins
MKEERSNGLLRPFVAEMIGTFTLTYIGASAICTDKAYAPIGLLGIAIAHGLALSIAVSSTMAISGGVINPAIAVALAVARKLSPGRCVAFIVAELLGAVIAGLAVKLSFVGAAAEKAATVSFGTPVPGAEVTAGTAVLVEAILTFLLATSVFLTAVDARAPRSIAGFGIGLTIAMDILAGGPITGASMNPARTFGPALVFGVWSMHWIYWVGPILGAAAAAVVYVTSLASRE